MKRVIVTDKLPPFLTAICIIGIIFIRPNCRTQTLNHEYIHVRQYAELWYIGFLVLYFYYQVKGWFEHGSLYMAYMMNPFEQEAFYYQRDPRYLMKREPYAWRKFV